MIHILNEPRFTGYNISKEAVVIFKKKKIKIRRRCHLLVDIHISANSAAFLALSRTKKMYLLKTALTRRYVLNIPTQEILGNS